MIVHTEDLLQVRNLPGAQVIASGPLIDRTQMLTQIIIHVAISLERYFCHFPLI